MLFVVSGEICILSLLAVLIIHTAFLWSDFSQSCRFSRHQRDLNALPDECWEI